MKKLLLILLFLPMIGFGQEVDTVIFSDLYHLQRALGAIEKGEYQSAVMHYGSAFQANSNQNASVYSSRGFCYYKLKKYNLALDDFNRAIRMDPDYASAYQKRGVLKKMLGLSYCSDCKRACDLGDETGCEWYYKQCK